MRGKKLKIIKIKYLAGALVVGAISALPRFNVQAENCPDVRIIFARGSGSPMEGDGNYDNFVNTIETKLETTPLSYDFINLDYPAVGVNDIGTMLGAYFGAGEAYEFGDSVNDGVGKIINKVSNSRCENTKYVLGGYSQGAMVVSKSLSSLNADKIIYAATFGDPKIYLPEGEGMMPAACRNQNLSNYRVYVPDCYAYEGLLGSYRPYQPEIFADKLGTWCNKMDIFCSSHFSVSNHLAYVSDNLYEDASRIIFDKITKTFGLENKITSPHDTVILIDSTGSMSSMIDKYKSEALRLAADTLNSGGRVALYDYRDLSDPYYPVKHCDFDSCTLELFEQELNSIRTDGGGDSKESLLSAGIQVMNELEWKRGATKSLVVLTDAGFLNPDRDGISYDDVVRLSKEIDPVNFYIITETEQMDGYMALAEATDGRVVSIDEGLELLTDEIMERYDSLPRVEESDEIIDKPTLDVISADMDGTNVAIKLETNAAQILVVVNDAVLGVTEEKEIMISGYMGGQIRLVPLNDGVRGDGVNVILKSAGKGGGIETVIPKAPNTGRK